MDVGFFDGMPDELYAEDLRQAVIVLSSARDVLENLTDGDEIHLDRIMAHRDTLAGNDLDPERIARACDFLNAIGQKFGMLEGMARAAGGVDASMKPTTESGNA